MTRTAYGGQLLGVLLLNAFLVALAASIVHRRAGGPAAAALVAGVLVVGVLEPGSLTSTWMPHLYLWPFLLLLVATASVCSGGWRELTALVLAGGLLVHGHVAFVLFVALPSVRPPSRSCGPGRPVARRCPQRPCSRSSRCRWCYTSSWTGRGSCGATGTTPGRGQRVARAFPER